MCRTGIPLAMSNFRNEKGVEDATFMIFPDDENGDVLRRMAAQGDDLTKPRNIDFTIIFSDATSAEQFAGYFHELGYKISVQETKTKPDFPWDVIVVKHMIPTYE